MTLFLVLAAVLAALALGFILTPLLRRRAATSSDDRTESNAAIYRDQLVELEAERAQGLVNAARYDESRAEIERRLAEDLGGADAAGRVAKLQWQGPRLALALALMLPLAAGGLYALIGTPGALDPASGGRGAQAQHEVTAEQIDAMVAKLAERLEREPDNVEGWNMLARSLSALGRFDESAKAYAKVVALGGKNADVLADYADVLAMAAGRTLDGEPTRLVQEALALDPNHVKALALAGTAEFARGDYDAAIAHWERLMKTLPADSPLAEGVRGGLATARQRAGRPALAAAPAAPTPPTPPTTPAAAGAEAVQGIVMLDAALAANVKPEDVLFVLARPADGSRMPLAVARVAVRDLPYAFRLDDSMAMAPGAKLSLHPRVVVTARISRSGQATPTKGDLEGRSTAIAPGTSGVSIVISKVIE